jgi:hypothetical protein
MTRSITAPPHQEPHERAESATTMINPQEAIYDAEEGEIVPALSDAGDTPVTGPGEQRYQPTYHQEVVEEDDGDDGFVGPKLLPATPIMRYAMREVVRDYICRRRYGFGVCFVVGRQRVLSPFSRLLSFSPT